MKLYLVRHCEAQHNVNGTLNSDPSVQINLTELGIKQANKLANDLRKEKFEIIYTSEFLRTQQTADYINKYHAVKVIKDRRLNDNRTGFEGESANKYLDMFYKTENKWLTRFKDGESYEDVRNRAKSFLNDLAKQDYTAALVVTHGSVISAIYGILNDFEFDAAAEFEIKQGEFGVFQI